MQLLEATCKFPGKAIQTKFGEKANAVFTTPTGEEVTVWGPPNYPPFRRIRRGDRVQLAKDHKGNHRLVENSPIGETPANSPFGETPSGWTLEEKRTIAAKVEQNVKLLKYCLETARAEFAGLVETEESFRSLATTLFINTQRG